MRVLFDINHPAHVHLFKNVIWELQEEDHEIKITSREKDITLDLLDRYGFQHKPLSVVGDSLYGLAIELLQKDWRLLKICREFDPDVLIGVNPAITHVAKLLEAKSIIMHDTGHANFKEKMFKPFADEILIPQCYLGAIDSKMVEYPSYHELAYLHPNQFTPDPTVLDMLDVDEEDQFIIIRTVGWGAIHDVGDAGITDLTEMVEELEKKGVRVFITSEADLPNDVEHCQIMVDPHRIHHLMYYADLYIGESATMATESAVLGTPAIFINTNECGNTKELDEKYGMVFNYHGEQRQKHAFEKAISVLEGYDTEKWQSKREKILAEKVDPNSFIIEQIENPPPNDTSDH